MAKTAGDINLIRPYNFMISDFVLVDVVVPFGGDRLYLWVFEMV